MNSISQYSINAVKTFRGHDGHGYSCNLLRNKKKVAEIVEDGWGGGLQFYWLDDNTSAVVHTRTFDDKPHSFNGTVEQSLFYAEIMKLPKIPASQELGLPEMFNSPDIWVDELVNEFLLQKAIKADLKKKLTIQCEDGKLLTWKISSSHTLDVLKKHALSKYPAAVVLNESPIEEVITIYKKAGIV